MNTPVKKKKIDHELSTPHHQLQGSPVYDYLSSLSPLQYVKSKYLQSPMFAGGSHSCMFSSPKEHLGNRLSLLNSATKLDQADAEKSDPLKETANRVHLSAPPNERDVEVYGPGEDSSKKHEDALSCGPGTDSEPIGYQLFGNAGPLGDLPLEKQSSSLLQGDADNKAKSGEDRKAKCLADEVDMVGIDIDELLISSPSFEPANRQVSRTYEFSVRGRRAITEMQAGQSQGDFSGLEMVLHSSSLNSSQHDGDHTVDYKEDHTEKLSSKLPEATTGCVSENANDKSTCSIDHWVFGSCKVAKGLKKRCLSYDDRQSLTKNLFSYSELDAVILAQSEEDRHSESKQVTPHEAKFNSQGFPSGIGLHLNSLTSSVADIKIVKQEAISSGGRVVTSSLGAVVSVRQKSVDGSLHVNHSGASVDEISLAENTSNPTELEFDDELNIQNSKKRRRRFTNNVENGTCRRCKCKRSKCLKLYCECFAAGVYCVESCLCQNCMNKPENEHNVVETRERIMSRNPLAFAPKVLRGLDCAKENKEECQRASAIPHHKTGCNCKKSKCLKKYCECFQGGVACSSSCRCDGCNNVHGKKERMLSLGDVTNRIPLVPEEVAPCTVNDVDDPSDTSHKALMLYTKENQPPVDYPVVSFSGFGARIDAIPLGLGVSCTKLSSCQAGVYATPLIGSFPLPHLKTVDRLKIAMEAENPALLWNCHSSPKASCVGELVSPKAKRISPPHVNLVNGHGVRLPQKLVSHPISSLQPNRRCANRDLQKKFC